MRVFTNGCFDLLHVGHVNLLVVCRTIAGPDGKVIVGLNSDESIKRLKGVHRPIIPAHERYTMLKSLIYVDEVHIFTDDTPYELIKRVRPDIIVKGEEWSGRKVVGEDLVGRVEYAPTIKSTTEIIQKCQELSV